MSSFYLIVKRGETSLRLGYSTQQVHIIIIIIIIMTGLPCTCLLWLGEIASLCFNISDDDNLVALKRASLDFNTAEFHILTLVALKQWVNSVQHSVAMFLCCLLDCLLKVPATC